MALTSSQQNTILDKIDEMQKTGQPDQAIQGMVDHYKSQFEGANQAAANPSLLTRIGTDISNRYQNIKNDLTNPADQTNKRSALSSYAGPGLLHTLSQVTGMGADVISEPFVSLANTWQGIKDKISASHPEEAAAVDAAIGKVNGVLQMQSPLNPATPSGALVQASGAAYKQAEQKFPNATSVINDAAGTAGNVATIAGAVEGAGALKDLAAVGIEKAGQTAAGQVVKDVVSNVKNKIATDAVASLDTNIGKSIDQAVRPSVAGKDAFSQLIEYKDKAVSSVKSIIENKDALNLVDKKGVPMQGVLPKTLQQFSDAIQQTKKIIFDKYNSLAKSAGGKGVIVDTKKIANNIMDTVTHPDFVAWEDQHPELSDYLLKRAQALEKRGVYTPAQAQTSIKLYNDSLAAFYKNPTYDSFSKAAIDSMIANNMRAGLDEAITSTEGAGYQSLKNEYGSLSHIEKDVAHRALVDARQSVHGLVDFSDIFSGADLIQGLLTQNPQQFTSGIAKKAIASWLKNTNSPNKIIENMFKNTENVMQKAAAANIPVK